jgi:hypothetical protein
VLPCAVVFVTAPRAFCYGCSCVSLRFFVPLGSHLANWPCIAFGCPSFQLVLPCPWSPNLGQALGAFRYGSSRFRAPMLRTRLALRLGAHLANSPCVAFGRPSCELALRCVRAPNLGEDVLKNLTPSQNWFSSVLRLLFLPSAPFVWSFFVTALRAFCYGSSRVSLRPFVRSVTALRAFGRPSCPLALICIWVPLLPTRLAEPLVAQPWPGSSCVSLRLFVRLGAHVAKSPCVWAPILRTRLALRSGAQPW